MKIEELFSVAGKVALVTGGSRGIGAMIARAYVSNGVKTYISSRKSEVCDAMAKELSAHGECISIPADLSSTEGLIKLVTEISKRETKLDILVNNAGATWGAPIDQFPEAGWDKIMTINVKSVFFLTQQLLPLLRASGSDENPARVINIASVDGMHAPGMETYSYSASKAGLIQLTTSLARHLAKDKITVNSVSPGPFESKMMAETLKVMGDEIVANTPRGRIGTPPDMAGVAIYLASRAGAYLTGTNIPIDGGLVTCL
ncbi:MAG: SDR family oxidoreductase [Planctomycetota bacterium]|nr:SDR family oxidoreductase [Planctomycetota bacterium]